MSGQRVLDPGAVHVAPASSSTLVPLADVKFHAGERTHPSALALSQAWLTVSADPLTQPWAARSKIMHTRTGHDPRFEQVVDASLVTSHLRHADWSPHDVMGPAWTPGNDDDDNNRARARRRDVVLAAAGSDDGRP
jgi:hypothetical protein